MPGESVRSGGVIVRRRGPWNMRILIKTTPWLLALFCALIVGVSPCLGKGSDTQLWTSVYTTIELNSRFDLLLNGQLRFGDDISALTDERVQTGFSFRALSWLTLSPTYTYINNDQVGYTPYTENRIDLSATMSFPVRGLRIAIKNTGEWRFRDPQGNSFRLRERLTLEHSIGPKLWGLNGYVSDEVFWDSDQQKWVRNRFYAGLKKTLIPSVKLDLFYMQQSDDYASPGNLSVIGFALRFYLNGAALKQRIDYFIE